MIKKLRRKFVRITMISLLVVLSLVVLAINGINIYQFTRKSDGLLQMLADNGGTFPENGRAGDRKRFDQKPERPLEEEWSGFQMSAETPFETRYFSVSVGNRGETEADVSHVAAVSGAEAIEMAQQVIAGGKETGYQGQYRYRVTPEDDGTLIIFVDCGNDFQTIRGFAVTSVLVGAACLALVLILVMLFSGRAIRPVIENEKRQKQFITDAGHELKTPVAVIAANTEVIEMCEGASEWTRSIHHQVDRIQKLLQQLLTMTKMEETEGVLCMADFPYGNVVKEAAEGFAAVARARNLQMEERIQESLWMRGDEEALRQLISILLDNATKYAPEGGSVSIQLSGTEKQVQLSVYNSCENTVPEDLDRLFDRFYRADESRARESGGYGIGLSVAQSIVRAHKGKISARRQEQGICFTAVFPGSCVVKHPFAALNGGASKS